MCVCDKLNMVTLKEKLTRMAATPRPHPESALLPGEPGRTRAFYLYFIPSLRFKAVSKSANPVSPTL